MVSKPKRLDGFLLNGVPDEHDLRDYAYEPALVRLRSEVQPPKQRTVLNQRKEGACTGFGLAAVINRLLAERGEKRTVSPRMLYEMAKKFDRWEGENYSGSSCRGAIHGWRNMGVCSDDLAPYEVGQDDWHLSIEQAKDARKTTLGAYYRIAKELSHYHAALNEVGVLYASARVHKGWQQSNVVDGEIPLDGYGPLGGHAFAIVGYDARGFYVQNSWGPNWGKNGVALWRYEDWLENVRDAWVLRLALSTPQIWHLGPSARGEAEREQGLFSPSPKRGEIAGHFVHIDDGRFDTKGCYWSDLTTVQETARLVAESKKYGHLLLYAHGGLNNVEASARRIVAMKETFKKNGIYPFHFMYDTGLLEQIKDLVFGTKREIDERTRGLSDLSDWLIEKAVRPAGRAIWREMKKDARSPFEDDMAGTDTIRAFLEAFAQPGAVKKEVHIVGHSTGAILLAALLDALSRECDPPDIQTCSLMAPACTHETFNSVYQPLVKAGGRLRINKLTIYNLADPLERGDTVTPFYRKSLLYLVSNSCEERAEERILGMQKFQRFLAAESNGNFTIEVSRGRRAAGTKTASTTHGGFDNDPFTMNSIMRAILGKNPAHAFTQDNLTY